MMSVKPTAKANVKVVVEPSHHLASLRVANEIASLVRAKPSCVLGLATGGTPVECYRELVRMHREEGLDFSRVTTFNLDEYVTLDGSHPQSFRYFMQQHLFEHINIAPQATHVPNGIADDMALETIRYEQLIAKFGGIDLQLLGIGGNGHIAFNEPGTPRDSRTRTVSLTSATIKANSRFFDSERDVPRTAITMGIGTILEAKKIVLLATGEGKREAVVRAVKGPVSDDCPASFLQEHTDVTFVVGDMTLEIEARVV
jgi:glucosamine-6-phosphate deaminase